jgi:hypothetical protein
MVRRYRLPSSPESREVSKMGHPDRRKQREEKRKEKMLNRRSYDHQTLDLTPYNAVGRIKFGDEFAIKYK